ncbi:MAG: ABC transporter permease [Clostridium sp.]|nr:ABC transporter permease [Clostridium sp.]
MRILSIVIKELKQNLRDRKAMALMILFPIVLIVILGTAFSKVMGDNIDLGEIKVIYSVEGKGNVSESFDALKESLKQYNVSFTYTDNKKKAIEDMENSEYSCYVVFNENNKEIKLYKNDRYNFNAGFIEGILNTFVQRYNVINEIAVVNPKVIPNIVKDDKANFVSLESLDKRHQPRAIDYYGVTMTTLIVMYAAMTAGYGMNSERVRNTINRMFVSPLRKQEIFAGKVIGFLLITMIQIGVVVVFGKYVIKVNWGDNIGIILAVLSAEIAMSISIGIAVSFFAKSEAAMTGILNLIIPITIFLGGGYVPIEQINSKVISGLSKMSPVKWINDSMFNVIYRNDYGTVIPAILINIAIALVLLVFASLAFRREEV